MPDLMSKFTSGELIALVAVSGGLLIAIIGIIATFWYEARKVELLTALKRDMLSQGMSAEDIRTVLEAGTRAAHHVRRCRDSSPV